MRGGGGGGAGGHLGLGTRDLAMRKRFWGRRKEKAAPIIRGVKNSGESSEESSGRNLRT